MTRAASLGLDGVDIERLVIKSNIFSLAPSTRSDGSKTPWQQGAFLVVMVGTLGCFSLAPLTRSEQTAREVVDDVVHNDRCHAVDEVASRRTAALQEADHKNQANCSAGLVQPALQKVK